MKNIPVYELFSATAVGLTAIVLMAFDIFGKSEEFYRLMNHIMPEWGWALICLFAFGSHFIGLFLEVRILRYIGLGTTSMIFLFLFNVNLFNFPNLMTGITGAISVFCIVAMLFVKDTDLIKRERKEKQERKKALHLEH